MTWALLRRNSMFDINAFGNISSGASEGPKLWSYGSSADTLATISASGYFDDVKFRIDNNDLIYVSASDGVEQLKVTSNNGATATTSVYIPASGGAPNTAKYIVQTPDSDLPNEQALSSLATGVMKNTTATGVVSIATPNVDFQAADAGLISIAGLTTAADTMIYTTASDVYATTALTAAGRNLLDDASASDQRTTLGLGTIATQNSNNVTITGGSISGITDLAIADGGTGVSTMTTAYAPVIAGTTATGALQVADTGLATSGWVFTSNGSSAKPSFQAIPSPAVSFLTVAVPLTSNNIKTMYTTPVELIAAPGAGNMIMIYSCFMDFTYSTAAYTGGGTVKVQYGATFGGGGASTLSTITAGTMGITSNYIMYMSPAGANSIRTDFINKSICISNLTAVFASGSGTAIMNIVYRIVTP